MELIPQYQWDTTIHCGDTVSFDFIANDFDYYPNGSRQDLLSCFYNKKNKRFKFITYENLVKKPRKNSSAQT